MFKCNFNAKTKTRFSVLYSFSLLLSLFFSFSSITANKINASKNTQSYSLILNGKTNNGVPSQLPFNIMNYKYQPYLFTENITAYSDIIDYKDSQKIRIKTDHKKITITKSCVKIARITTLPNVSL